MKKIWTLVLIALLFAPAPIAQAEQNNPTSITLDEQTFLTNGGNIADPQIEVQLSRNVTGVLGFFGYLQVHPTYVQFYVGPTFNPVSFFQFGFGVGAESARCPLRVGGFASIQYNQFVFSGNAEYGGSGFWYKTEFNATINDWVGLGWTAQAALGTGPRIEITLPPYVPFHLKIWGAPLYDIPTKQLNGVIGVQLL